MASVARAHSGEVDDGLVGGSGGVPLLVVFVACGGVGFLLFHAGQSLAVDFSCRGLVLLPVRVCNIFGLLTSSSFVLVSRFFYFHCFVWKEFANVHTLLASAVDLIGCK